MIRIALTGPESSGKTTLANALGDRLGYRVFEEFARVYLLNLNRDYQREDLDAIADGHYQRFNDSQEEMQLIDTDFVVMKIWSEVKYGTASAKILAHLNAHYFDLHILCSPDIPWEADALREHPTRREELFERYLYELEKNNKPFIIVSGSLEERIEKSLKAIASIQS